MLSNQKAAVLIKTLEKLNKDVAKSGILSESISAEQEYLIDKLTKALSLKTREIETAAPVLRLDRLKVFLNHLKTAKLIHKFKLGYAGYTAELHLLFPDSWGIVPCSESGTIGKYLEVDCSVFQGERFFFGLTQKQYHHLFYYYNNNPEWGNVKMTGRTGLAKFIENMEQFISYFEKGGNQC